MKLIDKKISHAELIEKECLIADCIALIVNPNGGK